MSLLSRGYSNIKFFPKIEKQCLTDIENPETEYSEQHYVDSKDKLSFNQKLRVSV
jgi:hypothetical protein